MPKTPQEFIKLYNGKAIDDDYVANVQCVDGFRVGCKYLGYPALPTQTGWADGYWWCRAQQNWDKYFEYITNPKSLQPGDWCFWARGSKSCPSSHVGMFVSYTNNFKTAANIFGENQGGNRGFRTVVINLDICGAFRPRIFSNRNESIDYVKLLYKNILGRTYDQGGLTGWVNALQNGMAAKSVVSSFFNSKEYKNKKKSNKAFITDCYKGYFNRKPDTGGYEHWLKKVEDGTSRQTILDTLGNSAEFKRFIAKYKLK